MIITWMLYALLVATLVAVGAVGVEAVFRLATLPLRWVWAGALLLALALIALAPGRRPEPPVQLPKVAMVEAMMSGVVAPAEMNRRAWLPGAGSGAVRELRAALSEAGRRAPESTGGYLLVLWASMSVFALAAIAATHGRFRRRRRRWPTAELQGQRVRVAPEVGPVVMGVTRPEIVVPRWFLDLSPAESRLVLTHESEHVRARDPLLLAVGWTVAALLAWNPAVWWMLARLRLAVEMDCDARVLRRGESARFYGSVLIELAGRSSRLPVGVLALADPPSQLERRLLAMTYQRTRSRAASAAALGSLALVALLAACAAELPTAADIEAVDVAGAEAAGSKVALLDDGNTIYKLDGVIVTRQEALALTSGKIASVGVTRARTPGGQSEVAILSRKLGESEPEQGPVRMRMSGVTGPVPVLYIDGVRKPYDARTTPFGDLRPDDIESISILKGTQRAMAIAGPDGANGVIIIRTKNGPDDGFDLGGVASEPMRLRADSITFVRTEAGPPPVYFIDGVRSSEAAFRALDPKRIESVSVFKEEAAVARMGGPEGANGVVEIVTRKTVP